MKKTIATLLVGLISAVASAKPVTVGLYQMNPRYDTAANFETMSGAIKKAAAQGVKLIAFPEVSLQSNPGWGTIAYEPTPAEIDYVRKTAIKLDSPYIQKLSKLAAKHDMHIALGLTELSADGKIYNTAVLLEPNGELNSYRKINLWDARSEGNEHKFWAPGTEQVVAETALGKIGLSICVDMAYDNAAGLKKMGADYLLTLSAWPTPAGKIYEMAATKNATDHGLTHIVVNQIGKNNHGESYGNSMVLDKTGAILMRAKAKEGLSVFKLEL